MKGTKEILQSLVDEKVKHVFGFPGGQVIPLYDELLNFENKMRHILVRHEQAAAHAADAYARVSGKAGVCLATSGPGATNLVTGIMNAYMDSVPLVALAGNVPTSLLGKDAFQETDMVGVTMPITKHNYQIRDPTMIKSTISNAFKIAQEGRPGPVFVDIPKDIQVAEVKEQKAVKELNGFKPNTNGHPEQIKKAAEMILNAERPVILAGGGVLSAFASGELKELVETTNTPIATTLMGKSCFDENHPLCLGMLGMHGRKIANYTIDNADVILAIGCRFSDRITGNLNSFATKSKIIHIDIDSAEIGKNVPVALPIVGDAKKILNELNSVIKSKIKKGNTLWSDKIKKFNKECNCSINVEKNPIDPRKVMHEMNKIIGDKDIVCTGVGQHQMYAAHFLKRKHPRTFISSGGAGTMGYGFPAAIGAKVAKEEVEVFDVDGDGSFAMVIQELATCKEENIKTIPIILNNSYLGMVRQWQEFFFDKRYSGVHLKRTPNFAKVADAYNLQGITVDRESEIAPAIKQAMKNDQTTLLDILIHEESNILPMFGPGWKNTEMFGNCIKEKGKYFDY